jgi:hypothetical protein
MAAVAVSVLGPLTDGERAEVEAELAACVRGRARCWSVLARCDSVKERDRLAAFDWWIRHYLGMLAG